MRLQLFVLCSLLLPPLYNYQLALWRKQAEDFTGERVSTADFNRVRDAYQARDESPVKNIPQTSTSTSTSSPSSSGATTDTLTGAVIWRVPGEEPLMKPSKGSPARKVNHTLALIVQLEKDIELTRIKAEKHRANIIQIKKEERRAKADARRSKVDYERSATVLLLKNRLERESEVSSRLFVCWFVCWFVRFLFTSHRVLFFFYFTRSVLFYSRLFYSPQETTHEKLIKMHVATVDSKKSELLDELNRISRKAYGLEDSGDDEKKTETHGTTKEEEENETETETETENKMTTTHKKRRQANSLLGGAAEAAISKHKGKQVRIGPSSYAEENEEEIFATSPMVVSSQRRAMDKSAGKKRTNPARGGGGSKNFSKPELKRKSKKNHQKARVEKFSTSKGPASPTPDMVMNALKGMMKGLQRPERTKNRWLRTPETKSNRRGNKRRQSHEYDDDDFEEEEEGDEDEEDLYEDDPDFVRHDGINGTGSADFGDSDVFLDQRAETPLEHVAWRRSFAQREPVVFLHLVSSGRTSKTKGGGASSRSYPKVIALKAGRTFIGRDGRSCDVALDSQRQPKMISKVHACFWVRRKGRRWIVECADCNSTNGTHINGKRVSSTGGKKRLNVGATVMFGKKSRREEHRSELLYVLADDGLGGEGEGEEAKMMSDGRGEEGERKMAYEEPPPQSPLNAQSYLRHAEGSKKRDQSSIGGGGGGGGGGGSGSSSGAGGGSGGGGGSLSGYNRRRERRKTPENAGGGLVRLDGEQQEEEEEARRARRLQRNSGSLTTLDAHMSLVPRRRSLLSRERVLVVGAKQEENFTNMMAEISDAQDMLRRPPTTPLKKRRSSLSRGGIRASMMENAGMETMGVENPGMETL